MRGLVSLALVALSISAPAHAKPKTPTAGEREPFQLATRSKLFGGFFDGIGTRPVQDGFAELDARAIPVYDTRALRIAAPVRVAYRRPFEVSYSELRAGLDLELGVRVTSRLRLVPRAGVRATLRPNWPDPYQPEANGGLGSTDRYSYWERHWGGRLLLVPARRHRASLGYEYRLFDYRMDPNFDPVRAPTHLVPRDRDEHAFGVGWDWSERRLKLGLELKLRHRRDFFAFARDSGTGRTHAAVGGLPANPLARYWGAEPEARAAFAVVPRKLWVDLAYAHEAWIDTFQGYYSYQGPRVTLGARATLARTFRLEGEVSFRFLRYGPDSYAAGAAHPALESGSRLTDQRTRAGLLLSRTLGLGFDVYGAAQATFRRTNYPNYAPFVFPASRAYDIDWDYDNVETSVGVAFRTD